MNKFFLAAATTAAFVVSPALADPETRGPHTADIKGCMMLLECTDGVTLVSSATEVARMFPDEDWSAVRVEMDDILDRLDQVNIPTFIADAKYFARNERALYDVVNNRMFINVKAGKPWSFMSSLRHEGWHAAQDCMGGGTRNQFMAVIHGSEGTPAMFTSMAKTLYPTSIVEWEAEAKWAGVTENMTANAMHACAKTSEQPWKVITPTPMTSLWLRDNGHL